MKHLILLGLFLFCACTVGEDYLRPSLEVPEQWSDADKAAQPQRDPFIMLWWESLGDPTLRDLIDSALKQNLTRAQAIARIKRARADKRVTQADWWPQISASGSYRRSGRGEGSDSTRINVSDGTTTVTGSRDGEDSFIAGFDAAWELDIFGKTRRDVEAAEANLEFARQDEKSVQTSLTAEVGSHYASLRGFQHRLEVARSNLELQKQSASIARRRYDVGFANALDTAQANAEVAATLAQIPQLESQMKSEMHALALLLGRPPTALYSTLETIRPLPSPAPAPLGFPADLLDRRPDILRAEANLHRVMAEKGSAEADWYPQFSLSALFSVEGNRFDSLTYWQNHIWNIGSSVFYPLFDGGRIRANIAARSADEEEARAAYEQSVLQALQEVENALIALNKEHEREAFLKSGVKENRKALDAAKILYAEGLSEFLNVAAAERALFSAEDALTQSQTTQILNYIALYKSLGGGWRDEELPR